MEAIEYLVYTLLFLVLIAFIGVIGYIIYDNYTYKNNLTVDLNTNFLDINQNFNSTSNIIRKLHIKHSSNFNVLDERIIASRDALNKNIDSVNTKYMASSNVFDNKINDIYSRNTMNSNLFTNQIDTFGYNMNKYFTFNNSANTPYNDANKKLFEYRTLSGNASSGTSSGTSNISGSTGTTGTDNMSVYSRLDLITKTTATAGLKVNSDNTNGFEICNKAGTSCFNMFGDSDSLYIYGRNDTANNIYIGSADKKTAPIRIEAGTVLLNDIQGSNYTMNSSNAIIDYINFTSNRIMTDVLALHAAGTAGAKGDKGDKGDTGAAGAKGDTGAAGAKGDTGAAGAKGDTGAAGAKGDKGDPGNSATS